MAFGRKGLGTSQPSAPSEDGRAWVAERFKRNEQEGSWAQAHAIGLKLFDDAYHAMKNERGVRIEDIVAMLASVGGHLCLATVLQALRNEDRSPDDIGMVIMRGHDGNIFYFGDAPNWLLCEAQQSLISLVFGAAHENGAPVSIDLLHDEMRQVAQLAGKPEFLDLGLPSKHQVDSPLHWARHFTPFVLASIERHFTPNLWSPMVVGFALQQAVDVGRQSLEPMMIARIALSCAMRAAKLDPQRVANA